MFCKTMPGFLRYFAFFGFCKVFNSILILLFSVSKTFDFTPRCFAFDSLHGYFRFTEVTSSAYTPDFICPFPVLQRDLHDLSQPGNYICVNC